MTFFSYVFYSLPTFWLGLMFIFIFAVTLHWLPAQGIVSPREWPPFNTPQYWEAFGQDPLERHRRHRAPPGPAGDGARPRQHRG